MWMLQEIFLLLASLLLVRASDYKIFCYWNSAANYRHGTGSYHPFHVDQKLCTHLAYGYFGIDERGSIKIIDKYLDITNDFIGSATRLKFRNNLKVLASVGGFKETSRMFSEMTSDMRKRDRFYSSVIEFLTKWNFDGIDVDWEYPTRLGGRQEDRKNFVIFLEELKIILQENKFILSVAVSAKVDPATLFSYDIPKIAKHADFINLLTFEVRSPYSKRVHYNAPLHSNGSNSVERAVKIWVEQSGTPSKLLLGIPFFVHTFRLANASDTNVNARSRGPGLSGNLTRQAGIMSYPEFCVQASKWTRKFDPVAKVPFAYKGDQWASYENADSINAKLRLLKSYKLGGAMVWSIDNDDFHGRCGEYDALMRIVNAGIGDPNVLTTQAPTTEGIGLCPRDGFFRNPWECQRYHECRDGQRIEYECSKGNYYDEQSKRCILAELVTCDQNYVIWKPGMKKYNAWNLPLNLKLVN